MTTTVTHRADPAARDWCRRRRPDLFFAAQFLPRLRRGEFYSVAAVHDQLEQIVTPPASGDDASAAGGCGCQTADERRRVAGAVLDYLFAGEVTGKAELDGFAAVAAARQLDRQPFDAFLDAAMQHAGRKRYATWTSLHDNLRRRTGSLALIALALLGDEAARRDATAQAQVQSLAVAMGMTALLAQLGVDGRRGCVLLPIDDLVRHRLTDRDILSFAEHRSHDDDPRIAALLAYQTQRLEHMFVGGLKCLTHVSDAAVRRAVQMYANLYTRQLERIATGKLNIFGEPRPSTLWDRLRAVALG